MKKNTNKIVTLLLIAVVAVGCYFVAGTYAKYTTSLSGNDTAAVAKWAWDYNGTAITSNQNTITFNLFDTIYDSNGTGTQTAETDVAANKIAPGTEGKFEFSFQNKSEVNAKYTLAVTETRGSGVTNANIEYSLDGLSWTSNLANLLNASEQTLAMGSAAVEKTVYWRWVYQVQDENSNPATYAVQDAADTLVGFAAGGTDTAADTEAGVHANEIKVAATVTFTQVD